MKTTILTLILLVCISTIILGGCSKLEPRGEQNINENAVTGDTSGTNISTQDSTDAAENDDSSSTSHESASGETSKNPTPTDVDSSAIDNNKTDSNTSAEEIQCDYYELLCDTSCVPNDKTNCGECGHDCTALAHVAGPVECEEGKCVLTL